MGERRTVLSDSGALIALERGNPFVRALVREVIDTQALVVISACVLARVWRAGAKQAIIAALLKRSEVRVVAFDETLAKAAGIVCGRSQSTDIADASVVLLARIHHASVVTSDPIDLWRLDSQVVLHVV